jgi:16S rRNA U1498 N3-methylase RsmE
LENSKQKLQQSKQADLDKLKKSLTNSVSQAKSLVNTILLKVDEIYGITNENKHKNDAFESYLSAKNTSLKEKIKNDFRRMSENEF